MRALILSIALILCAACIGSCGKEDPEITLKMLNDRVDELMGEERFPEAEEQASKALEIAEWECAPNDTLLAESLNNMALIYLNYGRVDEAAPLFERALRILKLRHGSGSRAVAVLLDNLSIVYYAQGRIDESASLFREATEIRDESPEPAEVVSGY